MCSILPFGQELNSELCSIKLYAWENAFLRKILLVRNEQELEMLKKIGIANVRGSLRNSLVLLITPSVFEHDTLGRHSPASRLQFPRHSCRHIK